LDLTSLILVAYINGIVERFGMGNYVLVVPGFSGQYVLPFIFSQDPQIDTGHNLSGLITISPGTFSFIWVTLELPHTVFLKHRLALSVP